MATLPKLARHDWTAAQLATKTDTEAVQDIVGSMATGAGGTYDDAAGTITLPGVASGGATKTDGQNVRNLRRPTLVIDKMFPNARHDHQVMWVDESLKVAYSVGQDRYIRKSSWIAAGNEASAFGFRIKAAAGDAHFAPHGVLLRDPGTGALLVEQVVGGVTTLLRAPSDGFAQTYSVVWTGEAGKVFLGPQSVARDDATGYLYLVEYVTLVSATTAQIWRSVDGGLTWAVWKSLPRTDGDPGTIRHWHSARYDSVSQRIYFTAGDQNDIAGIYRVNGAGTDIEPVILNSQISAQFGIVAPARAVDVMFFPTHIAWANDGGGGQNYVYRMARNQIGQASPVVERVAAIDNTGWYAQLASDDGSVWVVSTSTEIGGGGTPDPGVAHLYAVSNNGADVDEVAAVVMDGNVLGTASLTGLAAGSGGGSAFWLRAHNYMQYPNVTQSAFQFRARLAYGVAPIIKPTDVRNAGYTPQSRSWAGTLAPSASVVFGHTRCPERTRTLVIRSMGYRVHEPSGQALKIEVYNHTTSQILFTYMGGQDAGIGGDTSAVYQSFSNITYLDEIFFRVVETGGTVSPTATAFVEFAWSF